MRGRRRVRGQDRVHLPPVDGNPGNAETPLITAASYGDVEVARALIAAGADIEARAADRRNVD